MCCVYANPEENPYQPIFACLHQMSAALPGSGRNVPVCIETSKKTVLLEVTELERTPVT